MELAIKVNNGTITPYDDIQTEELQSLEDGIYIITLKKANDNTLRTLPQNNAMHKYFRMASSDLNDAGRYMNVFFEPEFSIPWDKDGRNFKELVWQKIMFALTGKTSTKKLTRKEVGEVYDVLSERLAVNHGITTPFPDNYSRSFENEL